MSDKATGPNALDPLFVRGSRDTPLSASRMNRIVRFLNSLRRLKITRGSADEWKVAEGNVVLQLKRSGIEDAQTVDLSVCDEDGVRHTYRLYGEEITP